MEYKLVTSIPHLLKFMTEVCQYIDKKTKQNKNKTKQTKAKQTKPRMGNPAVCYPNSQNKDL